MPFTIPNYKYETFNKFIRKTIEQYNSNIINDVDLQNIQKLYKVFGNKLEIK